MPRLGSLSSKSLSGIGLSAPVTPPEITIVSSYPTGTSASSAQTHFGIGQSLYFNGSQTSAIIPITKLEFATYPITIEFWVYGVANDLFILGLQDTATSQYTSIGNGFFGTDVLSNGLTYSAASSMGYAPTNAWTHIAFTLWSSTGSTTIADTLTTFRNGVNGAPAGETYTLPITVDADYRIKGGTRLVIGGKPTSTTTDEINTGVQGYRLAGYISEIRVSKTARYGTSAGTVAIPTSAFSVDSDTLSIIRAV